MITFGKLSIDRKYLPIIITVGLFILSFVFGSLRYENFFSTQVFLNLFIDKAFLMIAAVGMTFVILTGGIDLSVAGLVALTTVVSAWLLETFQLPIPLVFLLVLLMGAVFGLFQGVIIHEFNIQPFIATLAGLFFTRGMCYVISTNAITIENEAYKAIAKLRIPLGGGNFIPISVIMFLFVFVVALYLAHYTQFGRTVYAIGGNEQSATLMGLPVRRTKITVYALSGFCSALAGIALTFYMLSGFGGYADGLELDAIAAVVIGGTLLTGGYGYVFGTMFGVLIQGVIQDYINFDGSLNSWWTKIVVGLLTLFFIVMQRVLVARKK